MRETLVFFLFENDKASKVLVLTGEYRQEAGRWCAECLELGTPAYASTLEHAREELREAVKLQLNEITELGFIVNFLHDHGAPLVPITPPSGPDHDVSRWSTPMAVGAS